MMQRTLKPCLRSFCGSSPVHVVVGWGGGQPSRRTTHKKGFSVAASLAQKGVGVSPSFQWCNADLKALKPAWIHTWSPQPYFELPAGVDFVPVIWGQKNVNDSDLGTAVYWAEQGSKCIMGFNEPDGQTNDQAGLTAEQAAQLWPKVSGAARKASLRLGSPAMGGDATSPDCWLDEFLKATNVDVDFICVHKYPDNLTDIDASVDDLISYLKAADHLYNGVRGYNKKIWLTEFALIPYAPDGNPQEFPPFPAQNEFMAKAVEKMSNLDFLERYAWFCLAPWKYDKKGQASTCSLCDSEGKYTPLGTTFAGLQ